MLAACGDGGGHPPPTAHFEAGATRLTLEIAADDLIHFEFSDRAALPPAGPIATTPMVARTDYPGPTRLTDDRHGHLSTASLALSVDPNSLCIALTDVARGAAKSLGTLCPIALGADRTTLTLSESGTTHLYGLGEHFLRTQPNGDLRGQTIVPGTDVGNAVTSFQGGNTGNAQFPILYAVGDGQQYALFLDHPYAQTWDFEGSPWQVTTAGAPLRGYFLGGRDLLELRERYLDLAGRPPVPPRKLFGLWVSEFGYDDWAELEGKLGTLRAGGFPVDGFVLDLQWFGGVFQRPSRIGGLSWDEAHFPNPPAEIDRLRTQQGVGVMLIEEPYVDRSQAAYDDLAARGFLTHACDGCTPVDFSTWWGHGGMLDFTSQAAADYWHDLKRQALAELGVLGHWTDLGEPEDYSVDAHYAGFTALGLHDERGVHNLYNLQWAASIARGYARHRVPARPFILSRSGTSGIERYGAAMWSGDIGANMASLAAQLDVQMHMSFSGVDYFGSDVGGYFHPAPDGDPEELYTQWFADSALLDVPLRPHTENLCNCRETAPDRRGDSASNLANLRLRYRLVPYLYSLAHRAYQFGEPVVAPLVVYYPGDVTARTLGDEKLLGRDLLVATVSSYGRTDRDVYLPAGTWVDFRTQDWVDSGGEWFSGVPLRRDGLLQLPLYARAGAIVPLMHVDEQTMNALGQRLDGSGRDELIVRVYADEQPTRFTLYEDDGATTAYQHGALRTTPITQRRVGDVVEVVVLPAAGTYAGAPDRRATIIELAARGFGERALDRVTLNRTPVPRADDRAQFDSAPGGAWYQPTPGLVVLRAAAMDVATRKVFEVRLGRERPSQPVTTSALSR
jgi:alpha-glucosidase